MWFNHERERARANPNLWILEVKGGMNRPKVISTTLPHRQRHLLNHSKQTHMQSLVFKKKKSQPQEDIKAFSVMFCWLAGLTKVLALS